MRPEPPAESFERVALPQQRQHQAASEATKIETSRAIAEVQAAVVVAQQRPRNMDDAVAEMRMSCNSMALAEHAFYRFNRGDGVVADASISLARELARCFGNIDYGLKELSRDDVRGMSEMQAYAWDLQKNSRASTIFLVPHLRDKTGGTKKLMSMRDIYENNANNGARRLREMIWQVLPIYFIEEAKDLCRATVKRENSKTPIDKQVAECVAAFATIKVSAPMIEAKMGVKIDKLTGDDIVVLRAVYKSLKNGETTQAEEFPDGATKPAGTDEFSRAANGEKTADPPKGEKKKKADEAPAAAEQKQATGGDGGEATGNGAATTDATAAAAAAESGEAGKEVAGGETVQQQTTTTQEDPIDEPPEWSEGPKCPPHPGASWFIWGGWMVELIERTDPSLKPRLVAKFQPTFDLLKKQKPKDWGRMADLLGVPK